MGASGLTGHHTSGAGAEPAMSGQIRPRLCQRGNTGTVAPFTVASHEHEMRRERDQGLIKVKASIIWRKIYSASFMHPCRVSEVRPLVETWIAAADCPGSSVAGMAARG